jgi:hypothetical protein
VGLGAVLSGCFLLFFGSHKDSGDSLQDGLGEGLASCWWERGEAL